MCLHQNSAGSNYENQSFNRVTTIKIFGKVFFRLKCRHHYLHVFRQNFEILLPAKEVFCSKRYFKKAFSRMNLSGFYCIITFRKKFRRSVNTQVLYSHLTSSAKKLCLHSGCVLNFCSKLL